MTTAPIPLPPLDDFNREELCELVRILHGGMVRAHADYELLRETATQAICTMRAITSAEVAP